MDLGSIGAAFFGARRSLVVASLLACLPAGCTTYADFDDTYARTVYPREHVVGDVRTRSTGLANSRLLTEREFAINVPDLPIGGAATAMPPLADRCVVELRVRAAERPGHVDVLTRLRSPFFYLDATSSDRDGQLDAWMAECHCATLPAEMARVCFAQRLAASVDVALAAGGAGGSLSPLTSEGRDRLVRAAGWPFASYDTLRRGGRGLAQQPGETAYLAQRLEPGEELCIHTSTYAVSYLNEKIDAIAGVSEPAPFACFPWQTIAGLQSPWPLDPSGRPGLAGNATSPTVGTDPLARDGKTWKADEGRVFGRPTGDARYLTAVDEIAGPDTPPYRSALLVVANRRFIIPAEPTLDLTVTKPGAGTEPGSGKHRGSFVVLVRDERLLNALRQRLWRDDICRGLSFNVTSKVHEYLVCATQEWGKSVGIDIANADVDSWMRDVRFPSNVRPFVRIGVFVDGQHRMVRAGATLLNLIDERLGLSTQVFAVRSHGDSRDAAGAFERELVQRAATQVAYLRRAGLGVQAVDFDRAARLEDLMVPLQTGDRLTWLR
jgi:hypothetical protein